MRALGRFSKPTPRRNRSSRWHLQRPGPVPLNELRKRCVCYLNPTLRLIKHLSHHLESSTSSSQDKARKVQGQTSQEGTRCVCIDINCRTISGRYCRSQTHQQKSEESRKKRHRRTPCHCRANITTFKKAQARNYKIPRLEISSSSNCNCNCPHIQRDTSRTSQA